MELRPPTIKFADWEPSVGEIKDFIWKRIWKLLTLYWFAFLLTCLCQPLGRTITEAYGGELKSKIVYFLLDFSDFPIFLEHLPESHLVVYITGALDYFSRTVDP